MRYVLDTSAILSGKDSYLEGEVFIPDSVEKEIEHGQASRRLSFILERGLRVLSPDRGYLDEVVEAAERTGDLLRLSQTDMEVLALALQLGATLLSDDYSMQNVAKVLKIDFKAIAQEGIKEVYTWECRCTGCGRTYDGQVDDCPICGSPMKVKRKR